MSFKNRSVPVHQFSMVPRADIPRSSFPLSMGHKTTFDAGYLIPVFVDEVLPGDTFNLGMTAFCRLATPIVPFMDNLYMDSFFFFVPNRLVWENWVKMMGERDDPDDSIDFGVPMMQSPQGGWPIHSVGDYMGLPTQGQVDPTMNIYHSALFLRAYNLIYKEWFRDQNLQDSPVIRKTDAGDVPADFPLLRRGKRHDYFTSCLPWAQKGDPVSLPLGTTAPVITGSPEHDTTSWLPMYMKNTSNGAPNSLQALTLDANNRVMNGSATGLANGAMNMVPSNLFADLSEATAATINAIRTAFQIQRLLERDARGGTRYTEITQSHFGVRSPDARLQRPEYLGGGSTPVQINPVAQTSSTDTETPQGNLAAFGTVVARNGFSQSFTEHGMIIGLVSVRSDYTYQQGYRRMWRRETRYEFYWPVFAFLGEQSVFSYEIFATGQAADGDVFGYQERWAEYRHHPSLITGLMRSTAANAIDQWHLAQHFTSRPVLNEEFIVENPPMERVLAVGSEAAGQHFIADIHFSGKLARPMPLYSPPGMIDHF